ncbi:MAG: APC family permease [Candidatus Limnocylindrales bacterium]
MTDSQKPWLHGRKPGDRRVRVERPHSQYFRYSGPGTLVARETASMPQTATGRVVEKARHALFGRRLANYEDVNERLSKTKALAIFSSDPISSSAYATEEILRVLVFAGAGALFLSLPIAAGVAILLAVVSFSYRQIVFAYPSGGGDYAVARRNLPAIGALVVAGALLLDYVMTVAVSTASAAEQVVSAVPELDPWQLAIGVLAIGLITFANMRGLRESGNIFAIPTYLFVFSSFLMIAIGLIKIFNGEGHTPTDPLPGTSGTNEMVGILLLIRAFASGSVALTGTEAIANGVPAFKPPEPKNAAATLTAVAVILAVLFIGITFVANSFGVLPPTPGGEHKTVIAQVASIAFGDSSIGFYLFQTFTALILFLAANTSYNAFPRLAAILARDGYMPRQFSFRGDRLAFNSGIVVLSVVALTLFLGLGGETHALIPLYSVGVFVAFTIGQSGMVIHWLREKPPGWRQRLAVNLLGCIMTGVVAVVVMIAKAPTSLIVALIIPVLVLIMLFINRQYRASAEHLAVRDDQVIPPPQREERVVIPVSGINRAVVQAVNVGRSIAPDVRAVLISDDPEEVAPIRERWERQMPDVPLVIVESPYRALVGPLLAYLHVLDETWPEDKPDPVTFVVIPEYVARSWWERLLYNQSANRLRRALIGRPHTVVVGVPYRREDEDNEPQPPHA